MDLLNRLNEFRPVSLSFGSLYPALSKLEEKGFVESRWSEELQGSAARRKYYRITALGEQTINKWLVYRMQLAKLPNNPTLEI